MNPRIVSVTFLGRRTPLRHAAVSRIRLWKQKKIYNLILMPVFFSHHRRTCSLIHAIERERERERGFVFKCNKNFNVILYNKVFVSAVAWFNPVNTCSCRPKHCIRISSFVRTLRGNRKKNMIFICSNPHAFSFSFIASSNDILPCACEASRGFAFLSSFLEKVENRCESDTVNFKEYS
jgi:hypothetical protein